MELGKKKKKRSPDSHFDCVFVTSVVTFTNFKIIYVSLSYLLRQTQVFYASHPSSTKFQKEQCYHLQMSCFRGLHTSQKSLQAPLVWSANPDLPRKTPPSLRNFHKLTEFWKKYLSAFQKRYFMHMYYKQKRRAQNLMTYPQIFTESMSN